MDSTTREPLAEGVFLGGYRIVHRLAEGRFWDVYLARSSSTQRVVALNLLHDDLPEERVRRFLLKAGDLTGLEHPHVARLFEATVRANRAGIAALQPGTLGREVDAAARSVLVGAGYDEYPHATGHPIGLEVHELGPILGPPWKERYGTAVEHPIEQGMVFAVEPMAYPEIPACGGVVQVGLEENVEITPEGPQVIGTPQEELILIRP